MKISILFQRSEALALLIASIYFYNLTDYNWFMFVGLWLAIDVSMVGYVMSNKAGAVCYNIAHSLITPAALFIIGHAMHNNFTLALGCIFLAHIGLDRALGYGLKEAEGFQHTHLGLIGKKN